MTAVAQAASQPPDGATGHPGMPREPQPRQLIVTVYGLYSRAEGGWMSVASLITLLGGIGVDEPAVRSSISRLKRRGILRASRRDGAAGYELSEEALAIVAEGDQRIFRRERARLGDGWLLAVFSVPEAQRHQRHVLRSQLAKLGFGTAAPGVWIAPAHLQDATTGMLRRRGLDAYADLFHADHRAFGELAQKVRQWWDLDLLERLYQQFMASNGPLLAPGRRGAPPPGRRSGERQRGAAGEGGGSLRPEDPKPAQPRKLKAGPAPQAQNSRAFADYVRVLTDWRRLPYLDPGLPAELLPADWMGIRAADLFFTLQSRLEEAARAHVSAVIGT